VKTEFKEWAQMICKLQVVTILYNGCTAVHWHMCSRSCACLTCSKCIPDACDSLWCRPASEKLRLRRIHESTGVAKVRISCARRSLNYSIPVLVSWALEFQNFDAVNEKWEMPCSKILTGEFRKMECLTGRQSSNIHVTCRLARKRGLLQNDLIEAPYGQQEK